MWLWVLTMPRGAVCLELVLMLLRKLRTAVRMMLSGSFFSVSFCSETMRNRMQNLLQLPLAGLLLPLLRWWRFS